MCGGGPSARVMMAPSSQIAADNIYATTKCTFGDVFVGGTAATQSAHLTGSMPVSSSLNFRGNWAPIVTLVPEPELGAAQVHAWADTDGQRGDQGAGPRKLG